LREVRKLHPLSEIHLLAKKGLGDFYLNVKIVDRLHQVDKSQSSWRNETSRKLKAERFETIYCPHKSFSSAWLSFRIGAPRRVGFQQLKTRWAFTETKNWPRHLPDALRQVSLVTNLSNENVSSKNVAALQEKFTMQLSEKEMSFIEAAPAALPPMESHNGEQTVVSNQESYLLQNRNPKNPADTLQPSVGVKDFFVRSRLKDYLVIAPGSQWATKQWTQGGFAALIEILLRQNNRIVVVGTQTEKTLADSILHQALAKCEGISDSNSAINLCGLTSVSDLILIMRDAKCVITNDSGAMHVASLAGTPTVAIFGPTTLSLGYQPWNAKSIIVENNELSCRPCGKHGHNECPLGHHKCMKDITAAMVYDSYANMTSQR